DPGSRPRVAFRATVPRDARPTIDRALTEPAEQGHPAHLDGGFLLMWALGPWPAGCGPSFVALTAARHRPARPRPARPPRPLTPPRPRRAGRPRARSRPRPCRRVRGPPGL